MLAGPFNNDDWLNVAPECICFIEITAKVRRANLLVVINAVIKNKLDMEAYGKNKLNINNTKMYTSKL